MTRTSTVVALAFALLAVPIAAHAQVPGDLDPSFGVGGYRVVDIQVNSTARNNSATGLTLQSDGKVVMGGAASPISGPGPERMVAVRLTTAGALDSSFGTGGIVRVDALTSRTDELLYDGRVAIGPDGGIYLFNGTQDLNGVIGWVAAKLTAASGALDTGWDGDGRLVSAAANTLEAGDIAALASGKVLIFDDWWDTTAPASQQVAVSRRLASGAIDSAFGSGGYRTFGFNLGGTLGDFARVIYVQRDGRILVGGRAETGTATTPPADFFIARLTADGALDPTFGGGDGKVTVSFDLAFGNVDEVRALAVDARGRIYAGGIAGNFSSANDCALVRLLPDGTLDPAFGGGDGKVNFRFAGAASGTFNQIFGLALQGDGRIVAVGRGVSGSYRRVGVARLTEAGDLDPTFGSSGSVVYSFGSAAARPSVGRAVSLAEDGSIVLSGFTQIVAGDNDFVAARLYNDYVFADGFESGDLSYWSSSTL